MSTRRTAGVIAGLLLLAPLASFAADEAQPTTAQPAVTAPSDAGLPALKAGKDPKTGELRQPSAAEDAQLTRQMREFWAMYPRHSARTDRRTGATSLIVAPHSISTSVATLGADGKAAWTCAEDAEEIDAALATLRLRASRQVAVEGDR